MRGSIIKRGQTYSYVLHLGRDANGKKRQKWSGGFRTRKDAEAALAKKLDEVHTGAFADPGALTVGEYLEQWLVGITPSLREKTAFSYRDTLCGYVIPLAVICAWPTSRRLESPLSTQSSWPREADAGREGSRPGRWRTRIES